MSLSMPRAKHCALVLGACALVGCAPDADLGLDKVDRALASLAATLAQGGGELQVRRRSQAFWEPAPIGTTFFSGDWVRTGGQGFARVEYVQGGRIDLDDNAVVVIELTAPEGGGETPSERTVTLESGTVGGQLNASGKALRIKATAKLSARLSQVGTAPVEYRLSRRKDGTEVAVRTGEAALEVRGERHLLKSGQVTEIADEAPAKVQELIRPPSGLVPSNGAHLAFQKELAVALAWSVPMSAIGFRVQISRETGFRELAWKTEAASASANWQPSEAGAYYWRAAARDPEGRWSDYSAPSLVYLDAPVLEDRLVSPEDAAVFEHSGAAVAIDFEWEEQPDVDGYRLVIGRRADLSKDLVIDREQAGVQLTLLELPPGEYYWGVYSQGSEPKPLFSKPRRLVVKKVAKANIKVPSTINNWGE